MTGVDERTSAHGDSSVSKYVKGRPAVKPNWPGDGDCTVGVAAVMDIPGRESDPWWVGSTAVSSASSSSADSSVSSLSNGDDPVAPSRASPISGKSSGGGAGARVDDDAGSLTTRTIDRGDDGIDDGWEDGGDLIAIAEDDDRLWE